jgi:integrase
VHVGGIRVRLQPQRRLRIPDPVTISALAWAERASLPAGQLSDPQVIRAALDGLRTRLDGTPAAASTISRKRAVLHGALGYAVELGLLPANPVQKVHWHPPEAAIAISPVTLASPAQVRAILNQAARARPELAAFFGCLYYAALRPEEAVALRRDDLILPAHQRGKIILAAACPRTGTAWTSTGTPHEPRGLKHRPEGTIRVVPIPPILVRTLRRHLRQSGTTRTGGCSGRVFQVSTTMSSHQCRFRPPEGLSAVCRCGGEGFEFAADVAGGSVHDLGHPLRCQVLDLFEDVAGGAGEGDVLKQRVSPGVPGGGVGVVEMQQVSCVDREVALVLWCL